MGVSVERQHYTLVLDPFRFVNLSSLRVVPFRLSRFGSVRFGSFCSVSFRSISLRFISFRFAVSSFRSVPFCFFSFRGALVRFRAVFRIRSIPVRSDALSDRPSESHAETRRLWTGIHRACRRSYLDFPSHEKLIIDHTQQSTLYKIVHTSLQYTGTVLYSAVWARQHKRPNLSKA